MVVDIALSSEERAMLRKLRKSEPPQAWMCKTCGCWSAANPCSICKQPNPQPTLEDVPI